MLDGANEQKQAIQQLFDQSGLLKNMIQAHLLTDQQQYQQALEALDHCPPAAFELAELLRIRIHLEQQDAAQALTHLEFLNQHELKISSNIVYPYLIVFIYIDIFVPIM